MLKHMKENLLDTIITSVLGLAVAGMLTIAAVAPETFSTAKLNTYEQSVQSNVLIETGQALGSGVIVDAERRLILTNRHVVEDAQMVMATVHSNGTDYVEKGEVVWLGTDIDLAVLRIGGSFALKEAHFRHLPMKIGDPIYAVGAPMGTPDVVVFGHISGSIDEDGYRIVDLSIAPGNSGGGVYDEDGNLIGLSTFVIVWPQGFSGFMSMTGVGGIIDITTICEALDFTAITLQCQ